MRRLVLRTALIGSGLILGLIGAAVMFAQQAFLEMSHVFVARDPGLMSELSAPGGVLIITGGLMVLGGVRPRHAELGLIAGAVVYGSYGLGRLVSMALHGVPSASLITATVFELGVATLLIALHATGASARRHNPPGALPSPALR